MKDKLIKEIQASMALVLNSAQQDELRRVLTFHLSNVGISARNATDTQEIIDNEALLDVFIAAKTVYSVCLDMLRLIQP